MSLGRTHARRDVLWDAVDVLLADATLPGILAHRLGPLAANRLRRVGEPVPPPLALEERAAALCVLTTTPLLNRVRSGCEGRLVLLKGPEVGRLYPGAARRFGDIDILADDAWGVQRALVDQGLVEGDDPLLTPSWHHLQTLQWTVTGMKVDVHKSLRWPVDLRPPPTQEILDASVPSALGVAGISTPAPVHHALILAAHAWRHEPLWTLRDLIDIAAVAAHADERDLHRTANGWGIGRLWRTTGRAIDGLFFGGRQTVPLRTWARHLRLVRDRTGLEKDAARLLEGYWGMPPHLAAVPALRLARNMIRPASGESWRERATRVPQDLRKLRAPAGPRDG